jgi:putative ABC transport system permease protein
MRTTRLVRHSFGAIGRYRLRSAFMMLGSLVGAAALTLVVSVGDGAQRKMLETLRQLFGDSAIIVVAGGSNFLGGPRPDAARLTLDDIDAIAKELPDIETWDPQLVQPRASVRRGDAAISARVMGQSERSQRVWNRDVSRGEYFDASAVAGSMRVALIGETVRRDLFGDEDPLGADVLIGSVQFRVVGILEPFGTDIHGLDRDNEIVVPISTMMRRVMNVDTIGTAKLLLKDPSQGEEAAREIRRILRARHAIAAGTPDDFTMMTPLEVRRMVSSVQQILDVYLPLAAGVALVIAAIVAATLMLASVNQRVGEIGLRRAVGARPEDIRLQFLIESAATLTAGGIGGVVLGYVGAVVTANRWHLGEVFSWRTVALGVAVSTLAGLLAGVMPARRAARLNPVDALR